MPELRCDVDYVKLGAEIGDLVRRKQMAYGDSFGRAGEVLKILWPDGVRPEEYGQLLGVTRVLDKLFRIATARGQVDPLGELPWRDIAGYALLGTVAATKGTIRTEVGTAGVTRGAPPSPGPAGSRKEKLCRRS